MAANRIAEYLHMARERLGVASRVTLVLGNEAADLDSMVLSIAYALLLFQENADLASPLCR
jgi:hypothetical protein